MADNAQIIVTTRAVGLQSQRVRADVELVHREGLGQRGAVGKYVLVVAVVSIAAIGGLRLDVVSVCVYQEQIRVDGAEARRKGHVHCHNVVEGKVKRLAGGNGANLLPATLDSRRPRRGRLGGRLESWLVGRKLCCEYNTLSLNVKSKVPNLNWICLPHSAE